MDVDAPESAEQQGTRAYPYRELFITQPLGNPRSERYLVADVRARSLRIYRTPSFSTATEVCNAWRLNYFSEDPGILRELPNPRHCVVPP